MPPPARVAPRPIHGYFGGTFDPVQNGHLALARAALRQGSLDKVFFVPAGQPPHKPKGAGASGVDRVAMLRRAIRGRRGFALARWDLKTRGPAFTFQTLRRLRRADRAEWRLILGGDSLRNFPSWRRWREILRHHLLLVAPRSGASGGRLLPPEFMGRVRRLKGRFPSVSSTEVRRRLAEGKSLNGLTPPGVAAYIRSRKLYRP